MTPTDITALVRLVTASAKVRVLLDSGDLFAGYDGAEPQRTEAVAALDELEAATTAANTVLQRLITARHVEQF